MRIVLVAIFVTGLLAQSASLFGDDGPQVTQVEHETTKPKRSVGLGTMEYEPSKNEKVFFDKLAPQEKATGGLLGEYDIEKKNGTYVGWFGIVREIADQPEHERSVLLVEHKYFDGLTDTHIQALSFNGSGDFHAIVCGLDHGIKPLTLVKVYGKAKVTKDAGIVVEAEFVRNWHWGTFTFISAEGTQRGSEKWRQLNKVPLDDIYDPYPINDYYEQRLGPKPIDERQRALRIEKAGNISPALRTALPKLLDQLQKGVQIELRH